MAFPYPHSGGSFQAKDGRVSGLSGPPHFFGAGDKPSLHPVFLYSSSALHMTSIAAGRLFSALLKPFIFL